MRHGFVLLLLLVGSIAPPQAQAQPQEKWSVGNAVELCQWSILYSEPTLNAAAYERLPTFYIATITGEAQPNDEDVWWPVEQPASDRNEGFSGWVRQSEIDNCEPAPHQFQLYADDAPHLLQPGDVVVARLDSDDCGIQWRCWIFLEMYGGRWGHSAILVEQGGELMVAEATIELGVRVVPLRDSSIYYYDQSRILRPDAPFEIRRAAADYAAQQAGLPFNHHFLNVDAREAFYCSQLIWQAYDAAGGPNLDSNAYLGTLTRRYAENGWLLGMIAPAFLAQVVTPDDLFHSPNLRVLEAHD